MILINWREFSRFQIPPYYSIYLSFDQGNFLFEVQVFLEFDNKVS